MTLQQVRDPARQGIKLTATNKEILITKSGWKVVNFVGSDGETYERAEKNGVVKWLQIK